MNPPTAAFPSRLPNIGTTIFTVMSVLATEHQAFRDAIHGDASNIVTMREGLHTVRTVEAVLESARNGSVFRPDGPADGE